MGFGKLAVIGSSHGGFIAIRYALRYPEHLSHLILIGTAPTYDYRDEIEANVRRRGGTQEMMSVLDAEPLADDEWTARKFNTIAPLYFHEADAALANRVFNRTVWSGSAGARGRQLSRSYNVLGRLGDIQAPTLILVGRHDFITPPSQAERIHRGIQGSKLVCFEHSGHFPFIEEPGAFFDTVRAWLIETT